mmetsp:Transcript_7704/g.6959  ORF Transcript_7704/g.6959 Transcript_7704/m.6959 type:complete len:142 (+) Transcript_7704:338-763(+)
MISKLHTFIYQRFNQTLQTFKAITNLPRPYHLKAIEKINMHWNKSKAIMPEAFRNLKYFEITSCNIEPSKDLNNIRKLARFNKLKDVKINGTGCFLWRIFTFIKNKIPDIKAGFHTNMCRIDCEPTHMLKYSELVPWYPYM